MKDSPTKRYSLLLVNPKRKYRYHLDLEELCQVMHKKTVVHPMGLPTVAALTPDHYDITIIDEQMGPMRFEPKPDIVGLTSLATNVKRGYEIADKFRKMGVTVVMGGAQASFNVEEALQHVDSVVVGEAEGSWQQCLSDFENGNVKPIYKRTKPYEFKTSPPPRWDLIDTNSVMALGVQASRGCPYSCEFCSVRNMFGRKHRYREIDDVIAEIESLPKKQIAFVDDNLTANKSYARELMRRLKPLGVSWNCQCSVDVCKHSELLAAMAEAGCTSIMLGIESVNPQSLKEAGKFQNRVENYETGIKNVHDHGIHVIGTFIVGFDSDRLDAFDHIYEFTQRTNISLVVLNVLSAYPGTDLYEHMKEKGRISSIDPDLLNGIYPTMRYKHMSQTEVFNRYFETMEKMFAGDAVRKKAMSVFGNGSFQLYNDPDISSLDKFSSLSYIFRHFFLTRDGSKCRLFFNLFALVFKKKAAVGHVVKFLLLIASINGYLEFTRRHREAILAMIRESDQGPLIAST